jgi:hypothetical protein
MKPKILLCLALVLSGGLFVSTVIFAVEPEEFSADQIHEIWPELWKQGAREVKEPAVDPLSEQQVIKEMACEWTMMSRSDKLLISVETNRQVAISGIKDGKAWEKSGQWKVISDKLVLFLKEDDLPGFVFRKEGKTYIFDPWADTMMSEITRENPSAVPLKAGAPDRQLQLQSVNPVNGKISKTNILAILDSVDRSLLNKDAAAVVANFASNAVITATIVEGTRTNMNKDDTSSYRRSLEAGFRSFSDYKFARKDVAIQIAADGRTATSSSVLTETFRFDGKIKHAVTKESATFGMIEGKVLLTAMNSEVTIK